MLKRAHKRTFHKTSSQHLDCYVQVFGGRPAMREADEIYQLQSLPPGMEGR